MAWLISQAMMNRYSNSHYSQVREAGFSAGSCSDGEPSAQSKSTRMPQAYLLPGKTTGAWNRFPSGMTFEHSEATTQSARECLRRFEESGIDSSSVADSHVKTSPLQEREQDSTENDQDCGQSKRGSFAKYDPLTHSWRTRQRSLEGGFIEFSQTWPRWGSMRNGECSVRITPREVAKGKGFGLLPAPVASDGTQHGKEKWAQASRTKRKRNGSSPPTERITYAYYESDIPLKFFPEISEEMMILPRGWTDCRPSEMPKFREWQQQHGEFCQVGN